MRALKLIFIPLAILFLLGFILFLIAQIANLVYLADRTNPVLGDIVLYGLIAVVTCLLTIPLYTYLSLPKAILPPQSNDQEAVEAYQRSLIKRYHQNSYLRRQGLQVQNMEDVKQGVKLLDAQADKIISYNTARVFVGTAISQNGAFDSLIVFYFAINTLWRVSRVYFQRTTFRQLMSLYSNIAMIVVGAKLIEDQLDHFLEENIEEFMQDLTTQGAETTASMGARATKIIPGVGTVVESIVQGTFNGLMVLRIGLIAQKYCGATNTVNRRVIRRESFFEARKRIFTILDAPRKQFMTRFNFFSNLFRKKAKTT